MTLQYRKYRRKPQPPIEAAENTTNMPVYVKSPSGVLIAQPGDYIVQRTPEDIYVVTKENFEQLFEEEGQ